MREAILRVIIFFLISVVFGIVIGIHLTERINPLPELEPETITEIQREIYLVHETEPARITCYLWTGSPMANMEYPYDGAVASSDRSIPFGTEVIIDGKKYIVGDRTNKRFQDFEIQTMDIYWEGSLEDCLKFGVQYKDIVIINNK